MSDRPSRVAQIPYLNSVPYYVNWGALESGSEGRWTSTALPPRQLGMAMETGEADAGLLPVADLIRLEESVTPLAVNLPHHDRETESPTSGTLRLGIACRDRVDSVILFVRDVEGGGRPLTGRRPSLTLSDRDLETLNGGCIALTEESSTSVRLLRLLLEVRHGVKPSAYERRPLPKQNPLSGEITAGKSHSTAHQGSSSTETGNASGEMSSGNGSGETIGNRSGGTIGNGSGGTTGNRSGETIDGRFDAALVIGDQALRWRARPPEGFVQAMDLASEWCDWTDLPFVFACWSVRRDLDPARAHWLGQFLIASLEQADQDLSRLTAGLSPDLGSQPALTDYLRNFIYRLGPDEVASMARFRALLQAHDIACTAH